MREPILRRPRCSLHSTIRSRCTPSRKPRDQRQQRRRNRSQHTSCRRSSHSRLNHGKPKTEM
jgi:hypothetical protein